MESKYLKSLTNTITRVVSAENLSRAIEGQHVISTTPIAETGEYAVVIKTYKKDDYRKIVHTLIREKYDESEEFCMLRKGNVDKTNPEFVEYDRYAEECKAVAKLFIAERDSR